MRSQFSVSWLHALFGLVMSLAIFPTARAHDPGLSSARITRAGTAIEVRLALAWTDIKSQLPIESSADRPTPEQLSILGPALAQAGARFVRVLADGEPLRSNQPEILPGTTGPNEVLILLRWPQVSAQKVRLEFPILAGTPFGHRLMVTLDDAPDPVALLDARHQDWDLPVRPDEVARPGIETATPAAKAPWYSFVSLGVEHILTGFDHLCFLFALLLVAPRLRDVLTVVTTFTLAHSLTLAAAALGAVSLRSTLVEPLIAASIIYVGLENLVLRRQPRYRLAIVFGFGLIHGLGFASGLVERLPGVTGLAVVPPLLGFNAGVELGQLAVAACLVPLIRVARDRPNFSGRMQPACSGAIAFAGLVWLLQRV